MGDKRYFLIRDIRVACYIVKTKKLLGRSFFDPQSSLSFAKLRIKLIVGCGRMDSTFSRVALMSDSPICHARAELGDFFAFYCKDRSI